VVHPELGGDAVMARDTTVLISGNRIIAVGPTAHTRVPRGAAVIDAHGKWVIPGLIDSHVHFFQSGNLYTRPDVVDLNSLMPYGEEVQRNRARLPQTFKVYLASGVTSAADVGGPFWNFEVRDAARASTAAPRVATTGPLISMVARPQLDLGDPPIIRIDSADAARELVARELLRKPDYIKVWFIHRAGDDSRRTGGDRARYGRCRARRRAPPRGACDRARGRQVRASGWRRLPGALGRG